MQSTRPEPTPYAWVDAAPFRAHLRHVAEASGIPWSVIAVHAHIPPGLASRLLFAQGRTRLHRIPADCARRLLAVTPEVARSLRRSRTPAASTTRRLQELTRRGWSAEDLAESLRIPLDELRGVLAGRPVSVTLSCAHAVRALLASSDREAAGRMPYAA